MNDPEPSPLIDEIGAVEAALTRRQLLVGGARLTGATLAAGTFAEWLRVGGAIASTGIVNGGKLVVAVSVQPDTLDPAKSQLSTSFEVFSLIHSNLVAIDPNGKPVPRLARSWSSPNPRTWIFDLNPSARFHNGDRVTAEDVKFSIGYFKNPKTASPWADGLKPIRAVEVDSPTRFVLHLSTPYAPLLTILGRNGQILNPRTMESNNLARNPIGAGPFQFVEWVQGDHIRLKKFPGYVIHGQPHLDEVTVKFIAPTPAIIQAVKSRVINYAAEIPNQSVSSVKRDRSLHLWTSHKAGLPEMLAFNLTKAPIDNKQLRQAIAWSVDRHVIHRVAFFGTGEVGSEEVGSGSYFYDGIDPYKAGPDLAKAKRLLAQSGLKLPITIKFLALASLPYHLATGQILREALKPLRINLELDVKDGSTWLNTLLDKQYQVAQIFNESCFDPDQQYTTYLGATSAGNLFGYKDPAFNRAVQAAREETNLARRKRLYTQVRRHVYEDVPVFYNHYDTPTYVTNANVAGVQVPPTLDLRLETVRFT